MRATLAFVMPTANSSSQPARERLGVRDGVVDHLAEERVLVAVVVVQRSLGEAGLGGDVFHRRAAVAVTEEERPRGGEHGGAGAQHARVVGAGRAVAIAGGARQALCCTHG